MSTYGSRQQEPIGPLVMWIIQFTAMLSAIFIAGLGVRLYLHWSVRDTVEQINEKNREQQKTFGRPVVKPTPKPASDE